MRVLEGELVQAASVAPSLLESRLAAIGMAEGTAGVPPTSSSRSAADYATSPTPADVAAPASPTDGGDTGARKGKPRRRGLFIVVLLLVLLLAVFVCGLVLWQVVLPMMTEVGY
jgi:hypothetical protein